MSHTWFLLGLVECSHNGVNRRQQTNTVKNIICPWKEKVGVLQKYQLKMLNKSNGAG